MADWNKTTTDYATDKCVHQAFEKRVEKCPDAIALVFEGQRVTYKELNERANQLAHHLQKLGVGPEILVAICAERSLEMIVAIVGILKAGAAYLPLDPEYPRDRLAFMLEDARVSLLLTQQGLIQKLSRYRPRIICLDTDWENIAKESQESPRPVVTPVNFAYVIYTSGTTGTPKGVEITHYNVGRLLHSTDRWFRFNSDDVWTMFHSYAFDFSVWELWGALLYGGRLVVVPFRVSRSPEHFYELLCREKVTVVSQTPSAFRQLMEADRSMGERTRWRRFAM